MGSRESELLLSDRERLNGVVRTELPRLYRVAFRLTRNAAEAEDLVAQTLLNAAKGWRSFDGQFAAAWLFRIMKHSFLRGLRDEGKHNSQSLETTPEIAHESNIEQDVSARLTVEALVDQVGKLSHEHRLVIILCDIEGLSYDEVAATLEVPKGTLCSRLFRARKILQQRCLRYHEDSR